MKRIILGVTVILMMLLHACGGGGSAASGGTSSGLMSNTVSVSNPVLNAGQSTAISALAVMRGAAPTAMSWSVSPLFAPNPNDPVLAISDLNCATASFAPPAVANASGQGSCQVILTAPVGAKSGLWRITNTASSATVGAVSNSIDVTISALPESGFRLVENSAPIVGYANKPLILNIPFTSNTNTTITNVQYQWTVAAQNPSTTSIAGSRNSTATVIPTSAGQYRFDVLVNANVNGHIETAFGSVIASVYPATITDVIDAGSVKIVTPGVIASLSGSILNRDSTSVYSTTWRQLEGTAGGPSRVTLFDAQSLTPSFSVPSSLGSYGFEFKVVKYLPDGSEAISTGQATVIVQAAPSGVFSVTAGDVQSLTSGTVALLDGAVGAQGSTAENVVYTYSWRQVGATPAVVVLSNANTQRASFVPKVLGTYSFELTVTATTQAGATTVSGNTQVVVTPGAANNFALSATAGSAQSVLPNVVVRLAGAQTSQGLTDGVIYDYSWSQIDTTPSVVALSNANTPLASFLPTVVGTYSFRLTVIATLRDGSTRTATAETQVAVTKAPTPPTVFTMTVNAGPAQAVATNTVVTLTGSKTTQGTTSGETYQYAWTQVGTAPSLVVLSNANSPSASLFPSVAGTYSIRLTVTATLPDESTRVGTADTQVIVSTATLPTVNFALSASAGLAQSVAPNLVATLTGSQTSQGSTAGVTYAYTWSQIGASPAVVALSNSNSAVATFLPTVGGVYGFHLAVTATMTDGTTRTTGADTQVMVGGVGNTFTVSAGDAKVVATRTATAMVGAVTTQGVFSSATFSYAWTQVNATPETVTIANQNALTASFIPTVPGTYTFQLSVTAVQNGVTTVRASQTQVLVTP